MAGKRGFLGKLLSTDGGKPPITDADRDRWLEPEHSAARPSWGEPTSQAPAAPAGVDIVEMSPSSPLGSAGIREGDVITAVNGTSTPTESSLAAALNSLSAGARAEISVTRDDAELTVTVFVPA
jgi:S1-C subfamily serine protease